MDWKMVYSGGIVDCLIEGELRVGIRIKRLQGAG